MPDRLELGARILTRGAVPGPPRGPWERETPYPLAVDVNGRHGTVSFAMLDPYRYIAPGWRCEASIWVNGPRGWGEVGGDHDSLTSQTPFERPARAENSNAGWCDWHSNGGAAGWGPQDPDPWRHTFFGIAPVGTARLTVTDQTGAERDLAITPWNGAYVAVVSGLHSTLTGYADDGSVLGSFVTMDGLSEPEFAAPPPGWRRVITDGGNVLFQRDAPRNDEGPGDPGPS